MALIAGLAIMTLVVGTPWQTEQPPIAPAPAPPPVPTAAGEPPARHVPVIVASEAEIVAHDAQRLTLFRLAERPAILILDFPTLREQGLSLNRVAAFVEKADQPRTQVLNDVELARAIADEGETIETYYFGHDYGSRDLAAFFAAADRDNVRLTSEEEDLRVLLRQEGLLNAARPTALLTVPRIGDSGIDPMTRRIILRHELAHGEYFANPAYAAFVHRAWRDILTERQRAAFERFLAKMHYDMSQQDLVVNEMQAFLMFTPDKRYITPAMLGMTDGEFAALRAAFAAAMPTGWLRALVDAPLPP